MGGSEMESVQDGMVSIGADQDVRALISWGESNGVVLQGVRVDGRCFYTCKDLPAQHTLVSVPVYLLIHSRTVYQDEAFRGAFQKIVRAGASVKIVLTLFVAMERAKGECSFWAPYLGAIPHSFNTPLWFTEEELAHLQGTKVAASIVKDRAALEQLVTKWGPCFLSALPSNTSKHIEGALQWASLLWACTVVQSRGFTLLLDERRIEVLVPFFDMFDHSPSAHVTWLTNELEGTVQFISDAALPASTQICNNYGQKPNDELLQGYGFCLRSNPADVFYIRMGLTCCQENWTGTELGRKIAPEEVGTGAEARKELLWKLGIPAEYQISLREPLPRALFDAAQLCVLPNSAAYIGTGLGWGAPTAPSSSVECTASKLKAISSLRQLLAKSAMKFAGGPTVESDCQLLACWEQQQGVAKHKSTPSEREKFSVIYRMGQKEIVQAALHALGVCAAVTLRVQHEELGREEQQISFTNQLHQGTNQTQKSVLLRKEAYGRWMLANSLKMCKVLDISDCERSRPALLVTEDLKIGEVLLTIPEKMVMSAEIAYNAAHPLSEALGKMKGVEESIVLRLLLLYEYGIGTASRWAPFIKHLVYCSASPVCFGSELQEGLKGTVLMEGVSQRMEDLQLQYASILEPLRHAYPHILANEACTLEQWLWADVVVEECARTIGLVAECGEAASDDSTECDLLETSLLVLAPILSTLPADIEGAVVRCQWNKSAGLLTVHTLCPLQAGCSLQVPSCELDNETCLLQLRASAARINNKRDVVELCIGVAPQDSLAGTKEQLLQASGLGTVHYLTKDPMPTLLLAAVALCSIDSSEILEQCGASHVLASVKHAKLASAQAEEGWCPVIGDRDEHITVMEEHRTRARTAHDLASAAALSFVQMLQTPSRSYKAIGTLRKLISVTYKSLAGGSADDDQKLWQDCGQSQSTNGFAPRLELLPSEEAIWAALLAYRHGQKQILEAWLSTLEKMHYESKEARKALMSVTKGKDS